VSYPKKGFWQRLEERTMKDGPLLILELGNCWLYNGSKDQSGYPLAYYHGTTRRLSKLIYEKEHGEVPFGYDVHHKCHNKGCIRGSHLEALLESRHYKEGHPASKICGKGHSLNGKAYCEVCNRDRALAWYYKKKREQSASV
jgi:HNH endonuclease